MPDQLSFSMFTFSISYGFQNIYMAEGVYQVYGLKFQTPFTGRYLQFIDWNSATYRTEFFGFPVGEINFYLFFVSAFIFDADLTSINAIVYFFVINQLKI